MSNWWPYSPYWDIGIYIGGSNRACPQPNLTSSWVQTVNQQGWDYYLTWVGPQSPCASGGPYNTYINNDVTTAYNQGKAEANAAISAASNLGIYGLKAYYYDLEAYNMSNETCRWAANSFVNGWSYSLQVLSGQKAGVYGSPCNAIDWPFISNIPWVVWLADWNLDPDVWGLACLADGYWVYNQRLHQYRGGHAETWGSYTLNVDNDCANGLVVPNGHLNADPACTVE